MGPGGPSVIVAHGARRPMRYWPAQSVGRLLEGCSISISSPLFQSLNSANFELFEHSFNAIVQWRAQLFEL
eukprot:4663420-Karenia_brevis.AAC.1